MTDSATLTPEEWKLWDAWMLAQRLFAQEVERGLQKNFAISKAEFSVLVSLRASPEPSMRVGTLAETLAWEKSRVAHLLTRMEDRGFIVRAEDGASGRRTGVSLTDEGRQIADSSIREHAKTIRHYFLDGLTEDQAAVIRSWSAQVVEKIGAASPSSP